MLDDLQRAILMAVDRLTRETYGETDGEPLMEELARAGHSPDEIVLFNAMKQLEREGYLDAYFSGYGEVASIAMVQLLEAGRAVAHSADPIARTQAEARSFLGSREFDDLYPGAYASWAEAERLLWEDDTLANLTTIGHKLREAMQAFATALVANHRPPAVESDVAKVERRLGAVIALHRDALGEARREALEALGDLWEKTNALVQRQEHGAQKEGAPLTWDDARRCVALTLLCMVEFAATLGDLAPSGEPDF